MSFFHVTDELFDVVYQRGRRIVAPDANSTIAWRPEMPYMSIQSMQTMHHVPQLDRKLIRYAVSWIAAIATSMIGVVVYA